jgi:hypothetical protein
LQLSLLSYFEVSIYYAPQIQSAQRTNENSPAIYRWDHVPNPNESVKRTTEEGGCHVTFLRQQSHALHFQYEGSVAGD